ncbi:Fic family protein [Halomonas saccharevitans]|uniref:Fic family protein n=1 Tax=Halomonas saccharevitans TaxID=416872 RepID=A0ABU3NAR0_9GAMM|nr:Fic family protein [Halomonas saccharevitans]MDT8878187.1 Fic family protein [Halomonas saccharevitans]
MAAQEQNEIGYGWLARRYDVEATQPFPVTSRIGRTRHTHEVDGGRQETYLEAMRPADTLSAHLTFALKHEEVHLEFLARLFEVIPEQLLADWVLSESTGQYARRAGFLYEWLTGRQLDIDEVGGNYRDLLDARYHLVRSSPKRNRRWRINDNLPGTPDYCPMVRKTPLVDEASGYDVGARLDAMEGEFGADILRRSAVWLTIKESRASFVIEHEGDRRDRIQRFAEAMEAYCGRLSDPLDQHALSDLQRAILGVSTIEPGLRQSPVFVGSRSLQHGAVVHYVCPHWDWLPGMLGGLRQFLLTTENVPSILRAAVASFGFVFLHPLADGNGRVSRFLVNDVLRRDGVVPEPFILPVSAAITSSAIRRAEYDRVLERYSRPLMEAYRDSVTFSRERSRYDDGIESDFEFSAYDLAGPTWRYPDLTPQVEYLMGILRHTLEHEMHEQATLQRAWYQTRSAIKDWLEGPDDHIDRIIRAIRQNGRISGKLIREFPVLQDADLASRLEQEVVTGFRDLDVHF